MTPEMVRQVLDALKAAQSKPMADPTIAALLQKSTFAQGNSATGGLTFYDLELGAKILYPILTPLRNMIPRVGGGAGIQAAWRAITAINTTGLRIGVSGGNRAAVLAVASADYTAAFKGLGMESNVDFEAGYAAKGFDDVRALAAKVGLESLMVGEEAVILAGNNSIALGTTPTPSLSGSTTSGALTNAHGAYSVIAVALTLDAVINGSVSGGVQGQITRTNADGSSDTFGGGAAGKSAAAAVTIGSGTAGSIGCTVTAVNNAAGYAWFWGLAGSEVLGAITSLNSYVIIADAAGTQTAASLGSGDNSQNSLVFDGLLTQAMKSGSGSYVKTMATGTAGTGTPLTATGSGGIVEIDDMLKSMWDNYKLSPDLILVSSQEQKNISAKILSGTSTGAARFVFTADQTKLAGGILVTEYRNPYSLSGAKAIPIQLHPNMPAGTMLALTMGLPYPLANVPNVIRILTRQEYYQLEWPLRTRKYEYGVYVDEVLQHYFPPSMGVIRNIGNG